MPQQTATPQAPDWALPASATHTQVAPPSGFHRPARVDNTPLGLFQAQADIGGALVPGSSSYNSTTKQYTITSAGYNVWYTRDEFRYVYKKISAGDVSLAADIAFPDPNGYGDRKAVLVIRQSLDDDSPEAVVALHGGGMIHLAHRDQPGIRMRDIEFRMGERGPLPNNPDHLVPLIAKRIGIEKHGDNITLYVSLTGEPMHAFGPPIPLHFEGPFYAGIGFCSHLPTTTDTAVLSNVVLENTAGKVE